MSFFLEFLQIGVRWLREAEFFPWVFLFEFCPWVLVFSAADVKKKPELVPQRHGCIVIWNFTARRICPFSVFLNFFEKMLYFEILYQSNFLSNIALSGISCKILSISLMWHLALPWLTSGLVKNGLWKVGRLLWWQNY